MTADALLKRQISDLLLCLGILYRETYNQRARVFLWGLNRKVCNKGKGESPVNIMWRKLKKGGRWPLKRLMRSSLWYCIQESLVIITDKTNLNRWRACFWCRSDGEEIFLFILFLHSTPRLLRYLSSAQKKTVGESRESWSTCPFLLILYYYIIHVRWRGDLFLPSTRERQPESSRSAALYIQLGKGGSALSRCCNRIPCYYIII